MKSPSCTFCYRGDIEPLSHFLKVCPEFHHARTAAHNRVRQALFKLLNLKRQTSSDWKLAEETPMFLIGLCLNELGYQFKTLKSKEVR